MKNYEAPKLYVDEYSADTMIASTPPAGGPKNGTHNQNCFGRKCPQGYYPNENGDMCNGIGDDGQAC